SVQRLAMAENLAAYVGVERGIVLDTFRKSVANRQERMPERPRPKLRPDERMVLQSLFLDVENCDAVMAELQTIENLGRLPSGRIFQAVLADNATSPGSARLNFEQVYARLTEADRELLAEAVMREDSAAS